MLHKHVDEDKSCILSIFLDDTIRFELSGAITLQGTGQQLEDKMRIRFNQEMALLAENLAYAHRDWLRSRRLKDNDETYKNKRGRWRIYAKNRGEDLYNLIFRNNSHLSQSWGKAQQSVANNKEKLVLRFSGPRENLTLPFEMLHSNDMPLAIHYPMSRRVSNVSTHQDSWATFLRASRGQAIHILLLTGEAKFVDELKLIEVELNKYLNSVDVYPKIYGSIQDGVSTLAKAEQLMKTRNYHLVHYAGHAEFDIERPENSALRFADGKLNSTRLRDLLEKSPPQFLFLSCCSGAEIGIDDSSQGANSNLGLMDAALRAGIPAVLGFRWPVVTGSARKFAKAFYEGLGHYPFSLEYATWWARKGIFENSDEGGWDETWFSPILVVQNPDPPAT